MPNEFYIWLASQLKLEDISPERARELFQDWPQDRREAAYLRYTETGAEPLRAGRPTPEKWPADVDWSALMKWRRNPQKIIDTLNEWLSTGYITQYQARDIYDETRSRALQMEAPERQAALTFMQTGLTQTEWDALTKQEQIDHIQKRAFGETITERDWRIKQENLQRVFRGRGITGATGLRKTEPWEFGTALEKMRGEFAGEVPQTERWRDWFRSKYSRLIEQFEGQGVLTGPEGRRREETWRRYLAEQKPVLREQWERLSEFEKGRRPQVFAPRVQTVTR